MVGVWAPEIVLAGQAYLDLPVSPPHTHTVVRFFFVPKVW